MGRDEVATGLGEREITNPVDLCLPTGQLNPEAVGWTRRPLHRAALPGRGRNKRWEYWCVHTPEVVLALTVSDLDYAGLHAVWFLDPDGREYSATRLKPLSAMTLPERAYDAPIEVRAGDVGIRLLPQSEGVRLRARAPGFAAEVLVRRPPGHECLGVVVPWSSRRFQYTVKENTLPAQGTVTTPQGTFDIGGPDAWATLDHGRGRWPYRVTWNWGSGSGRIRQDGRDRVLGLQVGGKWTDGTGATENAITLDGVLHKIGDPLVWHYDRSDWSAPWRVSSSSGDIDLTFLPEYERRDVTQLGVLANETHQCFGTWHGHVGDAQGRRIGVDGIRGWAEEVRNRW